MVKRGRSGTTQALLNGRLLGVLRLAGSGAISFTYDQDWLAWEYAMLISLSLLLRKEAHQGDPVIAYLENLLPDNQAIRERVAAWVRAGGTDAWHVLEKIGRDCVGALQFVSGEVPEIGPLEGEPVSDARVADMLRNLASAPLGSEEEDDFPISIAGTQEKTALLHYEGAWVRPSGLPPQPISDPAWRPACRDRLVRQRRERVFAVPWTCMLRRSRLPILKTCEASS